MSSYSPMGQQMAGFSIGSQPCLSSLPLINNAINEAEVNIQAPRAIIINSALTAISIALQGLVDVKKPSGQVTPSSLMLIAIANSGERKSTAENVFLNSLRGFQSEQSTIYDEMMMEWKVKYDAWAVRRKGICKEIERKSAKGISTQSEEEALLSLERELPVKPKEFKILYEDSTSEALFYGMHKNLPNAGLISSEGAGVLEGRAFNDLSKQNAIWSGDSITIDRKTTDSFKLADARLTVSLMVQESAFFDYMKHRGEQSRGSGLWARFLICHPNSKQGTRFISGATQSWGSQEAFSARLRFLLEENLRLFRAGEKKRKVVGFTAEAAKLWIEISNQIELEICAGGRFHCLGDHASKLADVIARLAVLFHCFEGFDGDVSLVTLQTAVSVAACYSDEFIRLFSQDHQDMVDEEEMTNWLGRLRMQGERFIKKNHIRQYAPNRFRNKIALDDIIFRLTNKGAIRVYRLPGDKSTYVDLCPWMPPPSLDQMRFQGTNFFGGGNNQMPVRQAQNFRQPLPSYVFPQVYDYGV